jgi:small subunit ribosomal protein S18
MSEPKTVQRRINFRKANRNMTRRRHDIPAEQVVATNPELLTKFTTETGKILPRRVTGVSAKLHRQITRSIKQARQINLLP